MFLSCWRRQCHVTKKNLVQIYRYEPEPLTGNFSFQSDLACLTGKPGQIVFLIFQINQMENLAII